MPPVLRFTKDQDYDARMVHTMLQPGDPAGLASRAASMGLSLDTAQSITNRPWGEVAEKVQALVEERYHGAGDKLDRTVALYQQSWDEINDNFFSFIASRTEHPWAHERYTCVVSLFHRGISNWHGDIIARTWAENPYSMRKLTAHELIIAHLFSIFHADSALKNGLTDQDIWKIAEVSAWLLTGLEEKLVMLWPWISEEQKYPTHHNYPHLVPLQQELRKVFMHDRNFGDFLLAAKEVVLNGK